MLLKLVELRSSNWGRVHAAAAASNATPDNDPNYFMVRVSPTLPTHLSLVFDFVFMNVNVCYNTAFCFSAQNEPTFYTEDGTPFTAADPGESRWTCPH